MLLDKTLPEVIPYHDFYHEYYSEGGYKLRIPHKDVIENVNSKVYLNNVKTEVLENLRMLEGAPGVQMHELPPEHQLPDLDDDENPDERRARGLSPACACACASASGGAREGGARRQCHKGAAAVLSVPAGTAGARGGTGRWRGTTSSTLTTRTRTDETLSACVGVRRAARCRCCRGFFHQEQHRGHIVGGSRRHHSRRGCAAFRRAHNRHRGFILDCLKARRRIDTTGAASLY